MLNRTCGSQSSERFCRYEATQRNSIIKHILVQPGLTYNNSTFCPHSVYVFLFIIIFEIVIHKKKYSGRKIAFDFRLQHFEIFRARVSI